MSGLAGAGHRHPTNAAHGNAKHFSLQDMKLHHSLALNWFGYLLKSRTKWFKARLSLAF
jgi:hypothetical protein